MDIDRPRFRPPALVACGFGTVDGSFVGAAGGVDGSIHVVDQIDGAIGGLELVVESLDGGFPLNEEYEKRNVDVGNQAISGRGVGIGVVLHGLVSEIDFGA